MVYRGTTGSRWNFKPTTTVMKKDKIQIPRSPRKKPTAEIVLPCIPEGVQVGPELLGHIGKLKYSDHDVADEDKFPGTCEEGLYTDYMGTNRVGEPIDQPYQWATGLEKMENFRSVGPTTFWQRPVCNRMHQTTASSHTWRGYMVGQARPHSR
jgi:hypothetical protein